MTTQWPKDIPETIEIDVEPTWQMVANIAIMLIEDGTPKGKAEGRELVRDMGAKLALVRAAQKEDQGSN